MNLLTRSIDSSKEDAKEGVSWPLLIDNMP
jgi:hypothetical protein